MNSKDLAALGEFVYGKGWKSSLASALMVDDRNIRHWLAGTREMPRGAEDDLITLAACKQVERIADVIARAKGWGEGIDLRVYRDGSPVVSPHKRDWSNAVDERIMRLAAELLSAEGIPARVVVM